MMQHRAKTRVCDVCGCAVPLSSQDAWQQHTQGIRHRRNALGSNCLSVFERVDDLMAMAASHASSSQAGPSSARHRGQRGSVSKDPVVLALQQQAVQDPEGGCSSGSGVGQARARAQRRGPAHDRAASSGSGQQEQAAPRGWQAKGELSAARARGPNPWDARGTHPGAAASQQGQQDTPDWRTASQQLHQAMLRQVPHFTGRAGRQLRRVCDVFAPPLLEQAFSELAAQLARLKGARRPGRAMHMNPAQLACFAWMCGQQAQWMQDVRLAGIATFAALCLVVERLRAMPGWLHSLSLRLVNADGLYQQLLGQRGSVCTPQGHMMWQRLLRGIRQLAQERCELRQVELATPPGLLQPLALQELTAGLSDPTPRQARRMAVLMGTHTRLGVRSHLRRLPSPVLEAILDQAVPRAVCQLRLKLVYWAPGGALGGQGGDDSSSSSSEGSDSGSADSSGDSSSSSSDDDDEGPGGGQPAVPIAPDVLAVAELLGM